MRHLLIIAAAAFWLFGCAAPPQAQPSVSPPASAPSLEVRGVASGLAGQSEGANFVAYVVNQNSDDVVAIDVTAGAVIGRAAAGRNPHEIIGSPDGTRAVAVGGARASNRIRGETSAASQRESRPGLIPASASARGGLLLAGCNMSGVQSSEEATPNQLLATHNPANPASEGGSGTV